MTEPSASELWSFRRPRGDAVPQLGWPQPAAEWPAGRKSGAGRGHSALGTVAGRLALLIYLLPS